jgi:hypothetical protein
MPRKSLRKKPPMSHEIIIIRNWPHFKKRYYEKKKSAVCRVFMAFKMQNFFRPVFERCFQVRNFSFWITKKIGLTGVFIFDLKNKFRRVAAI